MQPEDKPTMQMFRSVAVERVRDGLRASDTDRAAAEEPLEVRLHDRPFAVIMRTPGADRELAAGFLLSERVLNTSDDLGTIEHCTDESADHPENIINVTLANHSADAVSQLLADRRQVMGNSSCGLCGRQTIESLRVDKPSLEDRATIDRSRLLGLPDQLRGVQTVFNETGGLHAAGLFTADGQLVGAAEDVGRHNAVDKVIGRMLMRDGLPLTGHVLFVSGRTSFEIVQKAFLAAVPIVAAVSAPSSLAIDLATDAGITLVGFLRGRTFNIYSHANRIV